MARARAYLANAKAATNDEAAMQILGLHWAGGNAAKVSALGKALAGEQHADGGWSQNPNLASDAYATGEALSALKEAGVLEASGAAYQKGVRRGLPKGREVSDGHTMGGRLLVRAQPGAEVPTLFPERVSVRSRPVDFLHGDFLGGPGT